jgi:hypothetical protein
MQRRRVLEMLGSFVVGGAVVAGLYELAGREPAVASEPLPGVAATPDPAAPDQAPKAGDEIAGPVETGGPVAAAPIPGDPLDPYAPREDGTYGAFPPIHDPLVELDAEAAAKYPKHGLVTGQAVLVRERTELDAPIVGILRAGRARARRRGAVVRRRVHEGVASGATRAGGSV